MDHVLTKIPTPKIHAIQSYSKAKHNDKTMYIYEVKYIDDLLATGGTMAATYRLVQKCNPKQAFINFVIELEGLNGRNAFAEGVEVETLLKL